MNEFRSQASKFRAFLNKSRSRITRCRSGLILLFLLLKGIAAVKAQPNVHPQSLEYEWPKDSLVAAKLARWQDQKFGVLFHWGLYSVAGILESWNICSEDWIERDSTIGYENYKKWYWGLNKRFNPVRFDPESWAAAAKSAGMRYVVFTTKHHDGFNMFDTKESDFKISAGPFSDNPKKDVAKYVFDAFRKKGFMIGAYFSKPDWHSDNFWWSKYATPDRNVNYDIRKYPWRWQKFQQFTYNQISELMHNYGAMDLLWLDGGWVRPRETVNEEVISWGAKIPDFSQDVNMPRIAAMARQAQPGLLIVDRTVHGPYENYQTPEQKVPEKQLDHPWESCLTLAGNWGYVPNDQYKTAATIIHTLIEVVAKGGSLLLGVGPRPDGTLSDTAVEHLKAIGDWLLPNGAAIYGTRTTPVYHDGNVWFTRNKNADSLFALVCFNDSVAPSPTISWTGNLPKKGSVMRVVAGGKKLRWKVEGEKVIVRLPKEIRADKKIYPALAIAFVPGIV